MLAHFGPLREESLGGTRQRVLLEAEAQSLASNALRDSQQDPWPRSLDRDTAQNTPQMEKIATSRTKKHTPQLYRFPTPKQTQGSVDCIGKQAAAETETLRVCLNTGLKAQTLN